MAVIIPIISNFDGSGIKKARKEFSQLEGAGAKLGFILKKSVIPATAAVGALGAAAFQAGEALVGMAMSAAEDQKSAKQLERTLKGVTKATDAQVASVEDYIDKTQRAVGVADDKLRPAFGRLSRATKDITKAQELLNLALDISAVTGKPLEAVANALGRAYEGQNTALGRLGLGLDKATLKSLEFDQIQALLEKRFAGGASQAADTFEGKMARLRIKFDELQERIGYAVIPILEKFANVAGRVMDAIDVGGLAGGVQQLRYEFGRLSDQKNFEWIRKMYDGIATVYNAISKLVDAAAQPLKLINRGLGLTGLDQRIPIPGMGTMPSFGQLTGGGPVIAPPLSSVPSPIELPGAFGGQSFTAPAPAKQEINVNVTSADPKAVVDALVRYNRSTGGLPVRIA